LYSCVVVTFVSDLEGTGQ